ncbi:MAG: TIGR04211 family SH3 domain-containing protein [Gammaproteobacteria bacterium]|nr:TIGR04211 family SH3 domain-containing protein [Gammaproteobacteria bacterium]
MNKLITALVLALALPVVQAETRYVSDDLELPVYNGTGGRKEVIQALKSGSSVELTGQPENNGYRQIKLANGKEGWVPSRFLSNDPGIRQRLGELQQQLDSARSSNRPRDNGSALLRENLALKQQITTLKDAAQGQSNEITRLQQITVNHSANTQQIAKENEALHTELDQSRRDNQALQQQNALLRSSLSRDWFLAGAGVLLGGMAIGLIAPKIRWRKRSGWGSF